MALTVREAMALGGLRRGEVLAGAGGLERIINAQNAELRRSIEIHREFTDLALDGQGLNAIVKTLGELVESSIALEDINFHLLASHVVPGVTDKHRQQTLAHHGTPPKVQQAAAIKAMLHEVVQGRIPHKVPPFPDLGLTAQRIISPVLAGRGSPGYLSLIDLPQHPAELAMMAIEHAAPVIP